VLQQVAHIITTVLRTHTGPAYKSQAVFPRTAGLSRTCRSGWMSGRGTPSGGTCTNN